MEELENARVLFGLEAQGHIPTIQKMLEEGKDWNEIAKVIGWCQISAREHYERYVQAVFPTAPDDDDKEKICPLLARAVEMLKREMKGSDPCWRKNEFYSFILQAEKHLMSTPKRKTT